MIHVFNLCLLELNNPPVMDGLDREEKCCYVVLLYIHPILFMWHGTSHLSELYVAERKIKLNL